MLKQMNPIRLALLLFLYIQYILPQSVENQENEDYLGYVEFYKNPISASILMSEFKNGSVKLDFIVNHFIDSDKSQEYPYHIHQLPIKNDDCDSAGGHWDPTNKNPNDKNENYKCTSAKVEACQHGDLSGKHGKLKGRNNSRFTIIDDQIKIKGKLSVINKSIVIHYPADKRRLICGTIKKVLVKDLMGDNTKSGGDNSPSVSTYTAITATVTSDHRHVFKNWTSFSFSLFLVAIFYFN